MIFCLCLIYIYIYIIVNYLYIQHIGFSLLGALIWLQYMGLITTLCLGGTGGTDMFLAICVEPASRAKQGETW